MEIPGFFGRESELSWLRGLWDGCTARDAQTGRFAGGPRMGVILAESGIGKSRLVQALYQQLTRDPVWDPPEVDYWPDAFNDQGMQLRVVPDMRGHVSNGTIGMGEDWCDDQRSVMPVLVACAIDDLAPGGVQSKRRAATGLHN